MLGNVLLTLPFFLFQNLDTCGGFCLLLARKKKHLVLNLSLDC